MNKLLAVFVALLVLAVPAFAAETPVIDAQVEIRHANLNHMHLSLSTLAQGFINYIEQIGGDTAELERILSDFDSKKADLMAADTHIEINAEMQEAGALLQEFQQEYNAELTANNGKPGEGLLVALGYVNENKAPIEEARENFWQVREENTLEIYDIQVERGEDVIAFFEQRGQDTSRLQEIMDDITAKRPALASALAENNPGKILGVQTELGLLAQQFGNEANRLLQQG